MLISRHVVFDEQHFPFSKQPVAPSFSTKLTQSENWLGFLPVSTPQQHLDSATANPNTSTSLSALPLIPIKISAASGVAADPTPSSLTISQIAAAHPIAADPPPLQIYSRRPKPLSGPSAPAADPDPFKSSNRAISSRAATDPAFSSHSMITRSRAHINSATLTALATDISQINEPKTYNQAKTNPNWVAAMNNEFAALCANKTWVLDPPNSDQNIVGCKWVYKVKRRADGSLERYKARLVTKGFHQEEGIDFFETYSPVVCPTTIRVILTLALSYGRPL